MDKKEEIIKFLTNTKVYVNGKSKEIQEKLFNLGFTTNSSKNTSMPFIIIYDTIFSYCNNMITFTITKHKEISAEDILNIKIEKEYNFKPFDKVLARSNSDEAWQIEFFERVENNCYLCLAGGYNECIPYNKETAHLLGTKEEYNR